MSASLAALARAYAAHCGLSEPRDGFEAESARRLALWPAWARPAAQAAAWALRWLAPALLAGRPVPFEDLDHDDKDALLESLQNAACPLRRGVFLLVKTLVLGTCYAGGRRA